MTPRCLVCGEPGVSPFVQIRGVPIFCNVTWRARAEALDAPTGDIRLGFCRACGYIFNLVFDPRRVRYTEAYENSLHYSARFQSYAHELASRLVRAYGLYGKQVVEIGCGRGEFLALLCDLGANRGYGFDPSYPVSEPAPGPGERVTIIPEDYSERQRDHPVDFLCCRHTLEHVEDPREFLGAVRRAVGGRTWVPVFFEVPDSVATVRDLAIWDLIYEHRSYFTAASLSRTFDESGFEVRRTATTYGGQFLGIEAVPASGPRVRWRPDPARLAELAGNVRTFARRYEAKVRRWGAFARSLAGSGRRVIVWGAGSKGVTFLNTVRVPRLEYVVDVNPRKQGRYVAGTGQRIVPPDFLRDYRPDTVVVMNPLYLDECRRLAAEHGAQPAFVAA